MGGTLSTTPATDLGAIVIKEALNRAGVPADQVDQVYMGCVIQAGQGQNVARQASIKAGLPIETPAAVVMSDELAKEVDFFSIGTNDLTQYTLAMDRQNMKLDSMYDPHHPAILRMIQKTIENGHKEGCWVGICGELGADTTLTETFLKMGVDELSVSPSFVLPIRKIIRETSVQE